MEEYKAEQARAFIIGHFKEQGDFNILPSAVVEAMTDKAMALDEEFIQKGGPDAYYDDEAAYEYIFQGLCAAFAEHKMYCMRFTDDYLDYNEAYLDSIGAIDWE